MFGDDMVFCERQQVFRLELRQNAQMKVNKSPRFLVQ